MGDYRLFPRADLDLEEISRCSATLWSAAQADRYAEALIDMMEVSAADPAKGREVEDIGPGYRKQAVG